MRKGDTRLRSTFDALDCLLPTRARDLYEKELRGTSGRCDRLFAKLFVAQWAFAFVLAVFLAPLVWERDAPTNHLVRLAIGCGAVLTAPALVLAKAFPGTVATRYTLSILQMFWSALLIHLCGGRIESHFHVFGSLAFVAFYRDWKALALASAVVVGDHLLRGVWWPESVYGIGNPGWWRLLAHAFWILFEDVVLFMSIIEARRSLAERAARQADLERLNATLERTVSRRTAALTATNTMLTTSLNELKNMQMRLLEASRRAGMADVATSVLHNVGNILNSVNVSADLIASMLASSTVADGLRRTVTLLDGQPDLGKFFASDPRAKNVARYLEALAARLETERGAAGEEVVGLTRNVDHIKVVVSMQQSHAKLGGVVERVSLAALIEEALQLNAASSQRHAIHIVRDIENVGDIECDRHKVFQVVMNLLCNACESLRECSSERRLTLRLHAAPHGYVRLDVEDNGLGIAPEIADRIFNHGFTTKRHGHGFGLHASACAAAEMGGQLTFSSEGVGSGATFSMFLPRRAAELAHAPPPNVRAGSRSVWGPDDGANAAGLATA